MRIITRIEELLKIYNDQKFEALWSVCKKVVDDVNNHNKLIIAQMSNYDIHDEKHSEKVIEIIEKIIDKKLNNLTCYELILLYMSAYLHDSAMALPAWEYDLLRAVEGCDEFFDNTLTFKICNDFKKVHAYSDAKKIICDNKSNLYDFKKVKDFVFAKDTEEDLINSLAQLMRDYEQFRNGYSAELTSSQKSVAEYINMSKMLRSEFIRQTHHLRVAANIYTLKTKISAVVGEFNSENFINDLSLICRCHGEQLSELFKLETSRKDWLGNCSNIQFVGMMLRLGDVIHFSSDRAPLSLFAEKRITDETSFKHWNAKFQDLNFSIDDENDNLTIRYTAFCSGPEVYYFIQDYLNWVDNELENYYLLRHHWERIKCDNINNYSIQLSTRVYRGEIKYNEANFIPKENLHFVLNQAKILELLMGVQLYKDKLLCLRELYQNSLDATKCIIAYNKQNATTEKLFIEFGIGEEILEGIKQKYLYCLDHGTGMNEYIINNFLLQIGNSYYKSKDFSRKNTGWEFDVSPTSQFGIGILSGYMLADKIGITTVYYEHNEVTSFVLEGINEHFYCVTPPELDLERIGKHGTIIKLFLKDEFKEGLNSIYIPKLPLLLNIHYDKGIKELFDNEEILKNNLHHILSNLICIQNKDIPVYIRDEGNNLRQLLQSNKILDTKNYSEISNDDLKYAWEGIYFFSGEPNPYLEVIDKIDLIENFVINVDTKNLELYSHISLPKKGINSQNLNYYNLFSFVGEKEGAILVDGILVKSYRNNLEAYYKSLDRDIVHRSLFNFIGAKRPVLTVDRNNIVSLPDIEDELLSINQKFVEELIKIVCEHIKKEKIGVGDPELPLIFDIVVCKFPSLAEKFFKQLCDTELFNIPFPEKFNFDKELTINELIHNKKLLFSNINFKNYREVYRRILISKLINVDSIKIQGTSLSIEGSNYCEFPIPLYHYNDEELSLSSIAIKADIWEGNYKEYDIVSSLWPIVNPNLFEALNYEDENKQISNHCKYVSFSGNAIQAIANLDPVLISPDVGIGTITKDPHRRENNLVGRWENIQREFWLFELSNHGELVREEHKSPTLFAYIAPRPLSAQESERLNDYEKTNPSYVKGVKEGWSILFLGAMQEYIICPGIVTRKYIVDKIPESLKNKDKTIVYYNTDGTRTF